MSDDEVSTPSVIRKGDGSPVRSALKGNRKTPRPKDGVKFGVVDVKVRQVSRFFEKRFRSAFPFGFLPVSENSQ